MAPHAEFQQPPAELAWLRGDVDLGFENLGIPSQQQQLLKAAFQGNGVAVPGTAYKLRHLPNSTAAVVEPATGQEPVLPDHWKQGAYTLAGNVFTYVGKRGNRLRAGEERSKANQDTHTLCPSRRKRGGKPQRPKDFETGA